MEYWQQLLYPLGFLSAIPFTGRFLLQWIASEKAKKSTVTPVFWILSLVGNLLLTCHSILQIQYYVGLIQLLNGIISWRNLSLMKSNHKTTSSVIKMMVISSVIFSLFMFLMSYWIHNGHIILMRSPNFFSQQDNTLPLIWHVVGLFGLLLFTSRFWIQWWQAERKQQSYLSLQFWLLSLSGAFLSALYFYKLGDPVNMIGPAVGIITYSRNIILIWQSQTAITEQAP